MKGLLHRHERAVSLDAFLDLLHRQVYSDQLIVFGSGGRIIRLPEYATAQEYPEMSIIRLGQNTSVRVNGKAAAIDFRLPDDDSIEIITGDKLRPQETACALFKVQTMPAEKPDRTWDGHESSLAAVQNSITCRVNGLSIHRQRENRCGNVDPSINRPCLSCFCFLRHESSFCRCSTNPQDDWP